MNFLKICSVAFILFFFQDLQADTLEDVLSSEQVYEIQRKNNQALQNTDRRRWFRSGSGLDQVFSQTKGIETLHEWIDESTPGIRPERHLQQRGREYVLAGRTFFFSEKHFSVRVIIPHPKFYDQLEFGLIDVLAELEPPGLRVEEESNIQIARQDAKLYFHKSGDCSILISLPENSKLQVVQDDCKNSKEILALTERIDVERLKKRISR